MRVYIDVTELAASLGITPKMALQYMGVTKGGLGQERAVKRFKALMASSQHGADDRMANIGYVAAHHVRRTRAVI